MDKCYIILNGEPLTRFDDLSDGVVIACDGALAICDKFSIKTDTVLGDFDSLGYTPENAVVYPEDKDYTDGELGLYAARDMGCKTVELLCGGGLRDDHFLGNLSLLGLAFKLKLSACLKTRFSTIYYASESFSVKVKVGTTISVVPLDDTMIVNAFGLKFSYGDKILERAATRGLSNVATQENIGFDIRGGDVYVIVNELH